MAQKINFDTHADPFYQLLKQRVREHFQQRGQSPFATPYFYFKGLLLFLAYLGCYGAILRSQANTGLLLLGYVGMGALAILLGLNLAHDAAHGAISRRAWVNRFFLHAFDLLGANSYMWRNRHVFAHHPYPNVIHHDSDIQQVPFVRIFPDDLLRKVHRFQHLYMPLLYFFYTLHWTLRRDFVDFMAKGIGAYRPKGSHGVEWVKLVFFKAFYLGYVLALPICLMPEQWGWILLGYLLMNFSGSGVVAIALISTHVGEHSVFPTPDEAGNFPHSWAEHQVLTTSDFCTHHPLVNFLFGGFNHHLIHHLFPRISHVHYVQLTPILVKTVEECGLSYHCEPSLKQTVLSHWNLLVARGTLAWREVDF
ncbi:MAG: acyl-CoA desaturase [Bacteroidota bacterium]